jgi:hypothetical protein
MRWGWGGGGARGAAEHRKWQRACDGAPAPSPPPTTAAAAAALSQVHTFDCTVTGKVLDHERHTFHRLCIGDPTLQGPLGAYQSFRWGGWACWGGVLEAGGGGRA